MPSKSVPMPTWSMPATRDDVVEVGDERRERRAGEARSEFAVEADGDVVGDGRALGGIFGGEFFVGGEEGGLLRGPGLAVGLVDEGGVEVDHADTAVGGESAELVVGEVAVGVGEGAGGGVGDEDGGAGDGEDFGEGAVGDVGEIDHHAEAVHLCDDLAAEGGEAGGRVGAEERRGRGRRSPEDSAQSLELVQVRVM